MNGDADQIVPYATSGPRAVEIVQNGTLKTYAGFPHGMPTTHAETINAGSVDVHPILIVCIPAQLTTHCAAIDPLTTG